jgi:hypothetical protein
MMIALQPVDSVLMHGIALAQHLPKRRVVPEEGHQMAM